MRILVPLAEGFEEIEAVTIVDVLRRAGIRVDVVGLEDEIVKGRNDIKILCDKTLDEVNENEYNGIVLPGGNPGYKNLMASEKIITILKNFNLKRKIIGAICASPLILAKIGILKEKKATCYPTLKNEIPKYVDEKVVLDDNIITSQGPSTALDFSLQIVKILKPENYEQIIKELLRDRYG
ncbi:MAG: DJ-1/PfpI family protein [Candidatus Aenigmatarchaeota archaeon]